MSVVKSEFPTDAIINRNFVIKVQKNDDTQDYLLSAKKYREHLGEILAQKHFKAVLEGSSQQYQFKLRRGLTIKFHSK